MAKQSAIGKLAGSKTKAQFAEKLASYTSLTSDEVKELFPTKSDREELLALIKIVNSDATEKQKKAELTAKIGKVGGAIIKIGKRFAAGM